jgi:acyl dehydratase
MSAAHKVGRAGGFDWHVKFLEPVRSGDRLHERITILEKGLSSKPGRGIVKQRGKQEIKGCRQLDPAPVGPAGAPRRA